MWRLQAARTLAWALLLSGWVGMGSLVQTLAPSPFAGFALMALWLLATGAFAELTMRVRVGIDQLRIGLPCTALAIAWALLASPNGAGATSLLPLPIAWAGVIALASAAARTCRTVVRVRPGPPIAAGAAGAALTWACLGDITDFNTLRIRLAALALAACVLLVLLLPARAAGARAGCRAALFDCSLPAWPTQGWRQPQRWPLMPAALVMLPMMCGLPLMLSLCRSDSVGPQAVLGWHFAAMFAPALWIVRRPISVNAAAQVCALLLAMGALAPLLIPGASGGWCLVLAHGTAWSIAWAVQLGATGERTGPATTPLAGAALNSLLVVALGYGLQRAGLAALVGWHLALGAAALGAVIAILFRCGTTPARPAPRRSR